MKQKICLYCLLLALTFSVIGCDVIIDIGSNETNTASQPHENISEEDHRDADDNGLCDDCGESVIVVVDFYAINDLHGKVFDTNEQPGVDELTTYLKMQRETDDSVILLSSGDMWQGSSESNLTRGMLVIEWMNDLDFVSMTPGNHEYDWGEEAIRSNAEIAEFPFLAINIYDRQTNTRVDYCQPSVMVEQDGVRIGIIGAMGNCYSSISSDKVENIYFKVGSDLTALVKAEAQSLRSQGADYIIYSIHDGYDDSHNGTGSIGSAQLASYYDTALSDGYVDLVFEGHTHQRYALRDTSGVYHLQNGGENKGISHVEVAINTANNKGRVNTAEFVAADAYRTLPDDPIVETLKNKYDELISIGTRVLGTNGAYRSSNELRGLVAKLYYEFGEKIWGDQYDIVLGGGFLQTRSPYSLSAGDVTYGQLQSLLPFDNSLVLCSVKGADLKDKFFETDNDNYFIFYGDYGASVKDSIVPSATYYIIVDTYTASYKYNRLTVVESYSNAAYYARDLLAEYIQAGGLA